VQAQAGTLGRTINPTMIPTLNQPVVDPTGKSNMRELFKKGSTRNFINKVAGALGVRTSGAGYNIETTKPRRMATGGMVYRKDGSMGPEFKPMGTDTVPAMLTPGEFVVKADALTTETLPILKQMNEGYEIPKGEGVSGLVKKSLWDEVGGNDPLFAPASWDDHDLFLRMLQHDVRFILPSSSIVWHFGARGSHRLEENNGQSSERQRKAEAENIKKWLTKWGKMPIFDEYGMIKKFN
jgi:hypothetical protein